MQYCGLMTLKKTAFKSIVRKGENADNLFPQCFLPIPQKKKSVGGLNLFCRLQMF